jgi:hypothetical protein
MFFLPAATDPRWPRAAILGLWTFTGLLGRAYRRPIVPLLGFILVPWSTVFYAVERGRGRSGPR